VKYFKKLGIGGRVLVSLVVAGSVFGIASAVQADIPDSGVIHGCYGKPGTPQKGQLRVRDADQGEQCRFYENQLDWNQIGPTGVTGPTGPTGPSDIWYSSAGNVPSLANDALTTLATVTVPAGNFAVSATGWAAGIGGAGLQSRDIRCYIDQPNGNANDTFTSVGADTVEVGGQTSWAVHLDVARPTGGTISVGCLTDSPTAGSIQYGAQLTAQLVATLHGTVFAGPKPPAGSVTATPK
jgi:hypothetical protein